MKKVLSIFLIIASAHLALLYFNFAMIYSDTIGVQDAARESRVAGNLATLFLALAVGLQFLIAGLLRPAKLPVPETNKSSPLMHLSESLRLEPWERYWVLLATSAVITLVLFGFLFFVAGRTGYLSTLLKFLGLA